MDSAEELIERVTAWAADHSRINALALVGSWARGAARADSDIDLLILTADPRYFLSDRRWTAAFGEITRMMEEDWGRVWSVRVFYRPGLEVEFGITTPEWAQTHPLESGTVRVVRNGLRVLYDPTGILHAVKAAVEREGG